MSKIAITKKDIIWSYVAQFFNIGSGLITLPLILHMLSSAEIGMNYLMITISTMVGLLDFGFAPQFARNITYVFAGAHELRKEGVAEAQDVIDYELLANMIGVAKRVYTILALVTLILMVSVGTWYIYYVTDGFTNVHNSLYIWLLYSLSVFFNIYYVYYSSLLMGRGMVMEAKKAMIAQKMSYLVLTFTLLLSGLGLLGVVIANIISPFVGRYLSYRYFYNHEMRENLSSVAKDVKKQTQLFKTIWYNSKKLGLVFLGSYAINKLGMFFAGLYLSLEEVASYGLMIQLVSIISSTAITVNTAIQPQLAALRAEGEKQMLITRFAFTMNNFYILYFVGTAFLFFYGPWILSLIGSNALLPSGIIMFLYFIVVLLEYNHSAFATFIVTSNNIPFVESSLLSGGAICLFSFLSLQFTNLGILGLVIVQGICQATYSNWKWPYVVCKEFHISFNQFLKIGLYESLKRLKIYGKSRN